MTIYTNSDTLTTTIEQYYQQVENPNPNEFDIVFSFFKEYCSDTTTAGTFTTYLFKISSLTGTGVLELLDTFKGGDVMQVTLTMCYYLNVLNENKVLLYGALNNIKPLQSVQRNIIQ